MAISTKMWCQSNLGWGLYGYQYKDVVPVKLGVGTIWLSVQSCSTSQIWGWGLYGYQYKDVVPVKFGVGTIWLSVQRCGTSQT